MTRVPHDFDLAEFWHENRLSMGRPFSTDKPRAPIVLSMDDHWLIDEMQAPSYVRYYTDADYAADLNRQGNDHCEDALGYRPFSETPRPVPPLRIEEVFGSRQEVIEGGTPWLEPTIDSIDAMHAKLDELEALDDAGLEELILSTGAEIEPQPSDSDGGQRTTGAASRGPATIGTSVLGTTELMFWLIDQPDDIDRFYRVLADILIRYQRILAARRNVRIEGYSFLDDNCALFSPGLYERFCLPVLQKVFQAFADEPGVRRYQHSDSAMEHLLPLLATQELTACNFGPTLRVEDIRAAMPHTEIHGQVAPMTLRNGSFDDIVGEVRRDFDAVGADGGLVMATAGSIPAGTSLDAIRTFMWAVHTYCRYD